MFDLELEVVRGPGSIPTAGNIFHWNFGFSCSQASDANIGLLSAVFNYEKKTRVSNEFIVSGVWTITVCTQGHPAGTSVNWTVLEHFSKVFKDASDIHRFSNRKWV